MSDNPAQINPADARRATALVVHYGRNDEEGVKAVLAEVAEVGRAMQLVFALLALNEEIMPALYTPAGLDLMSRHVLRLAGIDEEQPQ